jgi:hypothetical protein
MARVLIYTCPGSACPARGTPIRRSLRQLEPAGIQRADLTRRDYGIK